MDNYKLLTSKEIEELKRLHLVVTQDMINFPERAPHYYEHFCALMFDAMPILLSKLTPPPDAAVREAVERVGQILIYAGHRHSANVESHHLRTLLLAMQAPRLTGEQVDFVLHLRSLGDMEWATTDGNPPADVAAIIALARAAFPEAFTGEVGK